MDEELAAIEVKWQRIGSLTWRDAESPGALREQTYALMADSKGDVPALVAEVRRLMAERDCYRAARTSWPCGQPAAGLKRGEPRCKRHLGRGAT